MKVLAMSAAAVLLSACGVVGSPIPPELVGVAPTVDKQKRQHALEAERQTTESAETDPTLMGIQDMDLPPSQPVGIR